MVTDIISQLQRDEGLVLHVYIDSVGKRTIGYGHNLDANPLSDNLTNGITAARALEILKSDTASVKSDLARHLPWLVNLDDARQGVLVNMAFNIGVIGELAFHITLSDVQAGQYVAASVAMLQSKWATQVGVRAKRLSRQMATGIWQ